MILLTVAEDAIRRTLVFGVKTLAIPLVGVLGLWLYAPLAHASTPREGAECSNASIDVLRDGAAVRFLAQTPAGDGAENKGKSNNVPKSPLTRTSAHEFLVPELYDYINELYVIDETVRNKRLSRISCKTAAKKLDELMKDSRRKELRRLAEESRAKFKERIEAMDEKKKHETFWIQWLVPVLTKDPRNC